MVAIWPPAQTMEADVPGLFSQDTADQIVMVGRSQKTGRMNAVEFIPSWSQTGAGSNNRTYTLYNRRTDGTGTTVVAQMSMTAAATMTAFVPKSCSITSGGAALAAGDILEWESLHVGTGLPDPGGRVVVQFSQT